MRRFHDFPPYHFGIKARKPQSAETGICSHQWHRGLQAHRYHPLRHLSFPFLSIRASTLYLLRFLVILNAGLSLLEGRCPRLAPPAFFSRPSRMTGRIYRWASSQELIATSQATYG